MHPLLRKILDPPLFPCVWYEIDGTVYTQIGVSSPKRAFKRKNHKLLLTVLEIEDYYVDGHSVISNLNTRIELDLI